MSDTPRTDATMDKLHSSGASDMREIMVLFNFARQLERELAEARAELKRKDEVIILCGAVLKGCLAMNPLDPFQRGDLIRQAIGCVEAELAQGGKEST